MTILNHYLPFPAMKSLLVSSRHLKIKNPEKIVRPLEK